MNKGKTECVTTNEILLLTSDLKQDHNPYLKKIGYFWREFYSIVIFEKFDENNIRNRNLFNRAVLEI